MANPKYSSSHKYLGGNLGWNYQLQQHYFNDSSAEKVVKINRITVANVDGQCSRVVICRRFNNSRCRWNLHQQEQVQQCISKNSFGSR